MANNNHFELTLDTLAPVGSISGLKEYEKENKSLTIEGEATFKKVWFDDLNKDEVSRDCAGYKNAEWEAKDLPVESAFTTTGIYYYHLVLMDDVNNESEIYTLGPVYFDNILPVVSNVVIKDSRGNENNTNETTLSYSFDYTDNAGSGCYKAIVSGEDIDTITLDLDASNAFSGSFKFKDGTVDGNKTISVVVYDRAENVSVAVESNVILLDRELDKPTLLIQNAEGKNLPEYINYHDIKANLTVNETNIVAYKIWEGTEPESWTEIEAGQAVNITIDLALSANDGNKVVYAKIKDIAGNTKEADSKSVIIDSEKPVAELSSDKAIISKVNGFNKAILSFGNTADNEGGAGINYYELSCNGEVISQGTEVPANYEVTIGASEDGTYKYQLKVRDKALNEQVSEVVSIIFDNTIPTVTINELNAWYTAKFDIQVAYEDANSIVRMIAWTSTVATDTQVPEDATEVFPSTSIAQKDINWGLVESADNYMHIMLVDAVGNVGYDHKKFGYDSVAPVIKAAGFNKAAYPNTQATIELSYEDATSGVAQMRVSGHITDGTAEGQWETVVGTRQVTLVEGDGIKKVLVEIKDNAGLTASKEISCELDTTYPAPRLELYKADKISRKPAHSQLPSFSVRLMVDNDDFEGGVQYKLYGDFGYGSQPEASITKEAAELKDFVKDSGVDYMLIDNLFCTKGDGTKNIYVMVVDNAGNETTISTPATFVYDTTLPSVTVGDVDYNRISKVHVERRNSDGLIVGKWADETNFTFTPDSVIQAYKVCAYADASAAAAVKDIEAEVAIGMSNGSIGMSATGLNSNAQVSAKIKGADYEAALGGEGHDGAHIVVVYVKDLAGHWSVAAEF